MSDVIVGPDLAVITPTPPSKEFRWGAVIAGATVTSVTILFLLFLGSGVGLSLTTAQEAASASSETGSTVLNAGALYFFFSEILGAAAGGYLAGRLIGPMVETSREENFRSSTHGLVTWTLAVLLTVVSAGLSGLALAGPTINAAAILGASSQQTATTENTGNYWVDRLFRPSMTVTAQAEGSIAPTTSAPPASAAAAPTSASVPTSAPLSPSTQARTVDPQIKNEAGRIMAIGLMQGEPLAEMDREHLAQLVSQGTGVDITEARRRVDEVQTQIRNDVMEAAEAARVTARYVSLWLAATLFVGGFVAAISGMMGRKVDIEARSAR